MNTMKVIIVDDLPFPQMILADKLSGFICKLEEIT